jgi:hypothetical protein
VNTGANLTLDSEKIMTNDKRSVSDLIEQYTSKVGAGFILAVSGFSVWFSIAPLA